VHIKVEIQSNSEFQCLTSSPTWNLGPPWFQINVQDAYEIGFRRSIYAQKEDAIHIPMDLVPSRTKIGFDRTFQNNFSI
jgi:hypothetical protein